jgi:hypothetical protein
MARMLPTLLNLLQPPYGWILAVILVLPYWVLFYSVLLKRFQRGPSSASGKKGAKRGTPERDLSLYAGALTSTWLLITAFKVYQQYFAPFPIENSKLGLFDFGLGLLSLASWLGLVMLQLQKKLTVS